MPLDLACEAGLGGHLPVKKKSPALAWKTGDSTRIHPSQSYTRRLLREEYPGRFSDSRILLLGLKSLYFRPPCAFPPCPFDKLRASDSGFYRFRPRLQRRVRPRLPRLGGVTGFPSPEYHRFNCFLFKLSSVWLSSFFCQAGC